ncbi:MAG: Capsular polysaccharide synthesis enzyme CapA [Parcubacteria group bacterium Gr01-1014_18]|nr:MAG: Capsular polysaccharide synthesis enzyme CapA [Parcubacteria group bacterium Greene0416_36]TSC81217.1 MAG: Capsular polysaccharide synthesis enzyme CapA [Parcubacteria group bacterium Gr01-1014_18]TSC99214.1 MAG: Capsular polysaccharide synthesis enzyme CapA [Parcubacteria group bacterium Greene1014_20]TSD07428.1 MAG: Capsular polysaccharide synthesis enzyme CapA [Parcubacteria group bacterium Greene0714_2]
MFSFLRGQTFKTILSMILLFVGISLVLSLVQESKYESRIRVLVYQKEGAPDAYSAARFNDYASGIISKLIYSSSFLDKVQKSGFALEADFNDDPLKRDMEWKKMIRTTIFPNTGILEISVFHPNQVQADQWANGVAKVLLTAEPLGFGLESTRVSLIDAPLTSTAPVYPNVWLNLAIGAILGLMAGVGLVYVFGEEGGSMFGSVPKPSSGTNGPGSSNMSMGGAFTHPMAVAKVMPARGAEEKPVIPVV